MKRILRLLAAILLILGGIGWFSGIFSMSWAGSNYEMPLGDLEGIAVDSSGNIYCGAQFYSCIQKYDSEGQFLSCLHVNTGGGAFRVRVNKNDELEVATARMGRFYRFSPEGKLIEQKENAPEYFDKFGSRGEKRCTGPDHATYLITTRIMFPSVMKITASGDKTAVVSVPIHKWFIMGPFPAWLFWAGGILILIGVHATTNNKKSQPNAPADAKRPRRRA